MSPTHKQTFWTIDAGTGDIGAERRAQIAKAALTLHQHSAIIHATAAGGYGDDEAPEIALILHAEFEDLESLKVEVEAALSKEDLPDTTVTLEKEVYWFTLTNVEVGALKHSVADFSLARDTIDELVRKPLGRVTQMPSGGLVAELAKLLSQIDTQSAPGTQISPTQRAETGVEPTDTPIVKAARGTKAKDIPASELTEPMLLTEEKYKRMKAARGESVKTEIVGLENTLSALAKTTKTNTAVALMIIGGLIAVGTKMVQAYAAITAAGSLSAAITAAITAIGGVGVLATVAAVVAALILLLWVLLKDAVNQLAVINGVEKKINMVKDWIINGERFEVTLQVPDAEKSSKKPFAYGCGFYTYRKMRFLGQAVGFYGSTVGVAFKAEDDTEFSVGLDCPNTALGGTNCIRVRAGLDAEAAAISADSSGYSTETVTTNGHTCTGSRASRWGSINYAICSLE